MTALDLGHGHSIEMSAWNPDLELNPQCAPLAAQLPATVGAIVYHPRHDDDEQCSWLGKLPEGEPDRLTCAGSISFDLPITHEAGFSGPFWQVESWEPLTLSPSLLCHCGDHGFIREGKWVLA